MRCRSLLLAVVAFFVSSLSLAQSCFVWQGGPTASRGCTGTAQAVGACLCPIEAVSNEALQAGTFLSTTAPSLPSGAGSGTVECSQEPLSGSGSAVVSSFGINAVAVTGAACSVGPSTPQNPSGQCAAGHSTMLSVNNAPTSAGGTVCASDGCSYTAPSAHSAYVVGSGGCTASSCVLLTMQQHVSTGAACSAGAGAPTAGPQMPSGAASSTCGLQGGGVTCAVTSASGAQSAAFSGDLVTPSTLPPSGCVAYASGGVACVLPSGAPAAPTPPAPNSGVAGTTATPDGVVTAGGVIGNYFKPATVAGSTVAIVANGTGTAVTPVGVVGGGAAQAASSAGSIDCDSAGSAGAAGCADGTLPSLTRTDTTAGDVTAMWAGVQATPLFSAFSAVSTAFAQGGSCPSASVTFTTIKFTGDFMTSFCQVFEQELPTMIAISDAAWALLGLLILLSA